MWYEQIDWSKKMGKVKSNLISSRENFNFIVCKTLFSCHSENFQNSLKISSYDPYTMMRTSHSRESRDSRRKAFYKWKRLPFKEHYKTRLFMNGVNFKQIFHRKWSRNFLEKFSKDRYGGAFLKLENFNLNILIAVILNYLKHRDTKFHRM